MSADNRRKLRLLLDSAPDTAAFLEDVQWAIESLYAEDGGECPKGFDALDKAIEAFDDAEESAFDEDDEDEDEDD